MVLNTLRALFLLIMAGIALSYAESGDDTAQAYAVFVLLLAIGVGVVCLMIDIFIPQKSLAAVSGMFFGLVAGLAIAYGIIQVFELVVDVARPAWADKEGAKNTIKVFIGAVCCYLTVSFILQTKDDIRFVIPYVEFSKQTKGAHPLILDTSVIVDGRFLDICNTGIVDSSIVVPRFVITELQAVADSSDRLKRNRGRRGLDILHRLQTSEHVDVQFIESRAAADKPVDERLVLLARRMDGHVVTIDYNLNKVAQIHGVKVININDLANALKPTFLPGEVITVKVIKPGEEAGQGVGYLEDGTMVVIEAGRDRIGEALSVSVTSVLQTSAGRMVFGRIENSETTGRRHRSRGAPSPPPQRTGGPGQGMETRLQDADTVAAESPGAGPNPSDPVRAGGVRFPSKDANEGPSA